MRAVNDVFENRQLSRWGELLLRHPAQLGAIHESDAELVPLGDDRLLAVTVDNVVEEVECRIYRDPFTVGRTAAVAALSDLAAVGAEPIGLLLSVNLPPGPEVDRVQLRLAKGVSNACREAGTFVLGGDTNEAAVLSAACVACGTVPRGQALTRKGARAEDLVFTSGPLGTGAALAAAALLDLPDPPLTEAQWRPPIRLLQGKALRGVASCCIDTSDGLLTSLDQIALLNDVAIRITRPMESLLEPRVEQLRARLGLSAFPFLAAQHGEFELVFTLPAGRLPQLQESARALAWEPLEIGRVEQGEGLFIGSRPVNGTWLRNLLTQSGGDLKRYIRELCRAESVEIARPETLTPAPSPR